MFTLSEFIVLPVHKTGRCMCVASRARSLRHFAGGVSPVALAAVIAMEGFAMMRRQCHHVQTLGLVEDVPCGSGRVWMLVW